MDVARLARHAQIVRLVARGVASLLALAISTAGCSSASPAPTIAEPGATIVAPRVTRAPPTTSTTARTTGPIGGSPPPGATPARPSGALPSPGAMPRSWITGYYAGYERDLLPVAEIDWSDLTDVAVAFILPGPDGSLDVSLDADSDAGSARAHAIVEAAHAHGRRALASVGGEGMHGAWRAATANAVRPAFVANLVRLVEDYHYDGLDLDWEPFEPDDAPSLLALIRELRSAAPGVLLTMPIDPVNLNLPVDLSAYVALGAILDRLNVMSYGMAGTYEGWQSWHSSALFAGGPSTPTSVDGSVRAYLGAGIPAAKLGVGAGFFGLCYTPPVTGPGQDLGTSSIAAGDGTMSFAHIVDAYPVRASRVWDPTALVPYLSLTGSAGPDGCGYVTYEDEESLGRKAAYVGSEGLGGVIVWTINQGVTPNATEGARNPLLAALRRSMP